jgi:tetratricopeptide (TPR) repeat protein
VERAATDSGRVEERLRQHSAPAPAAAAPLDIHGAVERLLAHLERARNSGRSASFEISDCEHALAALALLAGPQHAALLAPVYRDLALHHVRREAGRARFYRERANALVPGIAPEPELPHAPPEPLDAAGARYNQAIIVRSAGQLDNAADLLNEALKLARSDAAFAAEIRYELACTEALRGPHRFEQAMEHLKAAFRGKTPSIEKRITQDIDEGGPLQALAAQPPFDKAVNDLLLDVSVS